MKEKFTPTNNDLSYYPLLHSALEQTNGGVLELGTGHGSTPLLNEYCRIRNRELRSFEEKDEWFKKFNHYHSSIHKLILISDWDYVFKNYPDASVIFLDHAPGERRKIDLKLYEKTYGIIVIHDSEPTGAGDYQVRPLFSLFKYIAEVKTDGAWATALSNNHNLTKWHGRKYGEYIIS